MYQAELARKLGVSASAVGRYAKKLGFVNRGYKIPLLEREIMAISSSIAGSREGGAPHPRCTICKEEGHTEVNCSKSIEPKKCSRCQIIRPRTEFYSAGGNKLVSWCNPCQLEVLKAKYSTLKGRIRVLLSGAKTRAKKHNAEMSLTESDVLEMLETQRWICQYSGIHMTHDRGYFGFSFDRKDSSNRNYTRENVTLCCWGLNQMKSDMTLEELSTFCLAFVNHQNLKPDTPTPLSSPTLTHLRLKFPYGRHGQQPIKRPLSSRRGAIPQRQGTS